MQNDANTFHLSTLRISTTLRCVYGVSMTMGSSIFAVQRSGSFKTSALKQSTASAMFLDSNRSPKVMARQCRLPNFASEDFAFSLWILFCWTGLNPRLKPRSREPGTLTRYSSRHGKQISWQPKCFAWVKSLMRKPSNSWALKDFDIFRQRPRNIPQISSNIINIYQNHQISLATFGIYCTSPSGRSI